MATHEEYEAYRRGFDAGRLHHQSGGVDNRLSTRKIVLSLGTFVAGMTSVAVVVASRRDDDTGDIFAGIAIVSGLAVASMAGLKVLMGGETPTWGFS